MLLNTGVCWASWTSLYIISLVILKIIFILILGVGILAAALVLNFLAGKLSLSTWYDFVKDPGQTSFLSYIWLFVLYPFGLGLAAYLISKVVDIGQ